LTLFAPFESLATIETRQEAAKFFHDNFPSAVAIAGEKQLLDDFENNPRGNLVTINVSPTSVSFLLSLLKVLCRHIPPAGLRMLYY
jgi:kynurenine 3-monooxygenase